MSKSNHIPSDIITSIFSGLPVKSLLRFRSLSKQWCSRIDNIDFIKLHLSKSTQTTSNVSLIAGGLGQLFHIDVDTLDRAHKIRNPFEFSTVLGSCNGVILLLGFGRNNKKLALFNPSTRTHRVLPDSHGTTSLSQSSEGSYIEEAFGLGFDYINDDFKIFSIIEYGNDQVFGAVFREAKIYSLKSDSWKRIKDCPYDLPCRRVWGVPINGSLHTIVNQNRDQDWPKAILAIDLALEDYRLMELTHLKDEILIGISLDKLGECLCTISVHTGFRTEIWMMKDYGVTESWTKLLSVAPPVVERLASFSTLGFSKDGDKVLLHYINSKLVWYDLRAKTLIDVRVSGLPLHFYVDVCVESLFRLDRRLQ